MLELRFASKKDAEEVVDELSEFGRPNLDKRVETRFDPSEFLTAGYEEAMAELEEVEEELDSEEGRNPAELLQKALTVSRSLFESGDYVEITDARTRGEAEDLLYETADELKDVGEVKERVDQAMREFAGEFKELRREGEKPETRPEVPEGVSDDFARYSLLMNFLVSPIIDIMEMHARAEAPLEAFTHDVHLDVTPISGSFDDLQRRVDLEAHLTYTVELGIEHVLHMKDVIQRLKGVRLLNPREGILYRFLILRLIADEILWTVRGKKKAPYEEFVRDVKEGINTLVHELGEEEVLPYTTGETVKHIVKKLKRAGLVRKKGNKISEA
ncbi:hypothetical protein AKJ39_02520 [candidate division MSBL1 archaeon SCGC-AAA259J03]|uniref:Uncharacterized protein n=2 Tax=candidate division MSBL1 TaxID=215777 RepID=A0A656YY74_9EURY|nr:hypothetical protein AKJ39_02520 [candidate division MSBL1 archaeon SCGC-AAA259J03]